MVPITTIKFYNLAETVQLELDYDLMVFTWEEPRARQQRLEHLGFSDEASDRQTKIIITIQQGLH